MPIPFIKAKDPYIQPAVEIPQKEYNLFWMANIVISAFDVNEDVTAHVEMVKFRKDENGNNEISPDPSIQIKIDKIFEKIALGDSDLEIAMEKLLEVIIKEGQKQGIIE